MVRCFIAFAVSEDVKRRALELQARLKELPMSCKFVEEENMHVTLSFLGEISGVEIEKINEELAAICKNFPKMEVGVQGLNIIPSESYIRVIALDIFDSNGKLNQLSGEIKKMVGDDVKPPHFTICRVRQVKNRNEVLSKLEDFRNFEAGKFTLSQIALMKSELSREGPTYEPLHIYELG